MHAPRLVLAALLALAAFTGGGCGGRTGLGIWIDGGGPQQDAGASDGAVIPDGGDREDGPPQTDGGGRQDAATGKNCADVMLCAFDSLSSGFDWQALLACTQGTTGSALTESGSLILCLAQNCASMLMGDGGGQMDILLCLATNCVDQICACEGIGDIIPPGLINCYSN
jgi:hypothetical protein